MSSHDEIVATAIAKEFFKREWAYPIRFWTGQDSVNEKLVNYYFGDFL